MKNLILQTQHQRLMTLDDYGIRLFIYVFAKAVLTRYGSGTVFATW